MFNNIKEEVLGIGVKVCLGYSLYLGKCDHCRLQGKMSVDVSSASHNYIQVRRQTEGDTQIHGKMCFLSEFLKEEGCWEAEGTRRKDSHKVLGFFYAAH